jgi:hypothetical protein
MLTIHRFTSPFCHAGLVLCLVAACRIDGHYDPLPIDAAPDDGPPSRPKFDVAYVSAWEIGSAATQFTDGAWARIVNTGPEPLDLSLAESRMSPLTMNESTLRCHWRMSTAFN